jgi:hypothetical protein
VTHEDINALKPMAAQFLCRIVTAEAGERGAGIASCYDAVEHFARHSITKATVSHRIPPVRRANGALRNAIRLTCWGLER